MENETGGRRYSVLVVDDEKSICASFRGIFRKGNYIIETAETGEEAIEILASRDFDALVCDYRLPGIDGIETVVKAKKLRPAIASVMMTGVGSERTIIEAFTRGKVDYYLHKPFMNDDVKNIVSLAIKESGIRRKNLAFQEELHKRVEEATRELKEKNILLEQKEKETARLNELLKKEREQLREANERLTALNEELERLSITDGLTRLRNHRHFAQRLAEEFYRAQRYEGKLSLLMVDIDDFKVVNDVYGHLAGDEVLRKVADLLAASSRQADLAARYGGEEFALLMPEVGLAGAAVKAGRLRRSIEESVIEHEDRGISVTISAGVATYEPENMKTPNDLIGAADKALYHAKKAGKNCVVVNVKGEMKVIGKGENAA